MPKTIYEKLRANCLQRRQHIERFIRLLTQQRTAIEHSDCEAIEFYVEVGASILAELQALKRSYDAWCAETPHFKPIEQMHREIEQIVDRAILMQRRNGELLRHAIETRRQELGSLHRPHDGAALSTTQQALFVDTRA